MLRSLITFGAIAALAASTHAQLGGARPGPDALPKKSERELAIETLTTRTVTAQFTQTPIADALDYFERYLDITILARYVDDRYVSGIDPDTSITLDVVEMPALIVLEMILDQCADVESMTWQLRNGYIEVGSKTRLSAPAAQEIRIYPVHDLLYEPSSFDNAPDFSVDAALNQGGANSGGGSGGGGFGSGGSGGGGFGSGGSSGGGGGLIGDPGDEPERRPIDEVAEEIVDLIRSTVESGETFHTWHEFGGDRAAVRHFRGTLMVRAPDFIHRQLGGYRVAR